MEGLRCPLCKEYFFEEASFKLLMDKEGIGKVEDQLYSYTCVRCRTLLFFSKKLAVGRDMGSHMDFVLPDYDKDTAPAALAGEVLI